MNMMVNGEGIVDGAGGGLLSLVSRSQTIKFRKSFLFVLIDDLLIYSLISRAVVRPRYRISTFHIT